MFPKEATWFYDKINKINASEVFPLLNIGSSTGYFRTVMQPYIESELFKPLRDQGRLVIHSDMKEADGVDIVGDISSEAVINKLNNLNIKSILCSHLLEHVEYPKVVAEDMMRLLPVGGYIFVSCPFRYPYHPDPIDTMLRPTANELASHFPGMEIVESVTISGGTYGKFDSSIIRNIFELIRLLMPFYKPNRWLWHFKETSATCVILRKCA